jgi:hypothetical protein
MEWCKRLQAPLELVYVCSKVSTVGIGRDISALIFYAEPYGQTISDEFLMSRNGLGWKRVEHTTACSPGERDWPHVSVRRREFSLRRRRTVHEPVSADAHWHMHHAVRCGACRAVPRGKVLE